MNSQTFLIIAALLLSSTDLWATHGMLKIYEKKFPTKDVTVLEQNTLIKFFIKHFGITKGIIFVTPLILGIWVLVMLYTRYEFKWFSLGVLAMMCVYHYLNYKQLANIPT